MSRQAEKRFRNFYEFRLWNEEMFRRFPNERLYFHSNPIVRYIENERVKAVLRLIKAREDDLILDVGCGEAYVMKQCKGNMVGLDLSRVALRLAKLRLKASRKAGELVMGDAQNLPFATRCFDKIICTELLEHVPFPRRVMSEVSRVVKSGGKVVLTIPHEGNIDRIKACLRRIRLFKVLFKDIPEKNPWHLHAFDLATVKRAMREEAPNLKLVEAIRIPFLIPIRLVLLFTSEKFPS